MEPTFQLGETDNNRVNGKISELCCEENTTLR